MSSEYDDFLHYTNGHSPFYWGSPSDQEEFSRYAMYELFHDPPTASIDSSPTSAMSRRSTSQGSDGSTERMNEAPSPGPSRKQGPDLYPQNLSRLSEDQSLIEGPPGFPPGVYALVTDDDGDSYWSLKPEYAQIVSQDYPPSIIYSSKENNATRLICLMESCESKGRFQRKADLIRHYDTVHAGSRLPQYDCPMKKCGRKGANGFSRLDHRKEHIRYYHHADVSTKRQRSY